MNNKALLQLGSELLFLFRHGNGPADSAISAYIRERKFLGATDKRFLTDVYYHAIRHLRRIDESILSAFAGSPLAEERFSAGFPVTSEKGAWAWVRGRADAPEARAPRPNAFDRFVDTTRLGLAAVELKLETAAVVAEELVRAWPVKEIQTPVQPKSIARMVERAAEVMELFAKPRRIVDEDRAASFPAWLWGQLSMHRAPEELPALARALNQQSSVAMRVNTLRASVNQAAKALEAAALPTRPSALAPQALILDSRVARNTIPHMRDGWFEMQDDGSQLVSIYADPMPGQLVVDACAGGGGKALHLAALMMNEGRLVAMDSDRDRLARMQPRIERSGAAVIDTTVSYGPGGELPSLEKLPLADLVLIDAPCSGTGTLRRNPEARWRLSPSTLEELLRTQRELLSKWAPRVRPGGALVYATCSLLDCENASQTRDFLAAHRDFRLEPPEGFAGPLTPKGELALDPLHHGCDGFYAARFVKAGSGREK